mgnify:CR=1 FL=1|jgi:hypothetical protein
MEKESKDKLSPLEDFNSPSKSSKSAEESDLENLELPSLNRMSKRPSMKVLWENHMPNKPEDNNSLTSKDSKL